MQGHVGRLFGNYRLVRLIGEGGYSEVYLAEHIHLNTQHAIKILTGTNLQDSQRQEFLIEARTIANLQQLSPHIVQIHDFGIEISKDGLGRGVPYLVMEYASKGTLRNAYPHGKSMPLDHVVFYVNQIAEALQCAHDQRPAIVHCDVKPENMLLRNIDHVLLSDFGIAMKSNTRIIFGPGEKPPLFGTAAYIAPERLSGIASRASDQYSLGIVVYEWLCGERPFEGTDEEIMAQHRLVDPESLHSIDSHITKKVETVVFRALNKKPEDRYPSVREFAQALEKAAQFLGKPFRQAVPAGNGGGLQMMPSPDQPDSRLSISAQLTQPLNVDILHDDTTQPGPPQPALLPNSVVPQPVLPLNLMAPKLVLPPKNVPSQPVLPPGRIISYPTRTRLQEIRMFFDFSPEFARDRRFSFFRSFGFVLNILSAIAIGLLLRNIFILVGGLLLSCLMFSLCIRAVEEVLAMFFGTIVALYWGGVGWVIGVFVAPLLHLDRSILSPTLSFIFFAISFYSHIHYVLRKNL